MSEFLGDLAGRVAIISGVARGQGRSHALTLARHGVRVVGFDLCSQIASTRIKMSSEDDLAVTQALIENAGGECFLFVGDVRDSSDTQRAVDECLDRYGRVDIVLANAGIDSIDPTLDLPDKAWDDVIGVNLTGVFRTIRPALKPMIEQGTGGSIVVTSSVAGMTPYPNHVHYCTSKYGVIGIVQCLALEMAAYNVRVNAIAPAAVDTPLAMNPVLYQLFTGDPSLSQNDAAPYFTDLNLLQRPWLQPEEVSNAILWLVSDAARAMTGSVLPIDLGLLRRGPFNPQDCRAQDRASLSALLD